jgi:hypothetical protein
MLLDGTALMKFGRRGYPHQRHVWLSDSADKIRWRKPNTKPGLAVLDKEVINVSEITDVVQGATTSVFLKNMGYVKNAECCFSIVTAARSLDLEADTPAQAEEWIRAFLALKKYRKFI